jgi:hypothetical protein
MRTPVLAILGVCAGVASIVHAQAPKAPTVKEVLYSAADSIGQLRTAAEVDRIATMTYTATGTLTLGNQPCKLKEYKASVNWLHKGMRVDYTCEGQARRVEVVNHDVAWNETTPGVGASPAPAGAAAERQLVLWTLPAGVVKAATAAGARTTVAAEGGKTVLSFPVVDVPGATIRAFYNPESYLLDRVETRLGAVVTDITYTGHGDWNGEDYLSDVQFPKRIVQKRGPTTIADLTIAKTNTYNPYVIMPVPPSLKR